MNRKACMLLMSFLVLVSTGCREIKGEQLCGAWNSDNQLGQLQLEITPWRGKFLGYMLQYNYEDIHLTGAKENEFILLTDLVYDTDQQYIGGQFYLAENEDEYYELELELLSVNRLQATYKYEDHSFTSVWWREGSPEPDSSISELEKIPNDNNTSSVISTEEHSSEVSDSNEIVVVTYPTKPHSLRSVVGYHKVVELADEAAFDTALEELWIKLYEQDFSDQLNNIVSTDEVYVVYSNYNLNESKVTLTIGYQVSNLEALPENLNGVIVPSNRYYQFPLTQYEAENYTNDEAWTLLYNILDSRRPDSCDFEVYQLDDYAVKEATIWIAEN